MSVDCYEALREKASSYTLIYYTQKIFFGSLINMEDWKINTTKIKMYQIIQKEKTVYI